MEGDSQRREYVLNETGKIWVGSYKQPKGRRWIYGQFDDVVLPATMYLLEQSGLAHTDRGSPVQVVRAISQIVSSHLVKRNKVNSNNLFQTAKYIDILK